METVEFLIVCYVVPLTFFVAGLWAYSKYRSTEGAVATFMGLGLMAVVAVGTIDLWRGGKDINGFRLFFSFAVVAFWSLAILMVLDDLLSRAFSLCKKVVARHR